MKPQRTFAPDKDSSYFVTFSTEGRRRLFLKDEWASLFIDVLQHYRTAYELHEFVVMHDHVHLILTPTQSLEKAVQLIKGGFSYRAKRELQTKLGIWQRGFTDHRIRDTSDYAQHRHYIHQNPVRKGLCQER